ncbi:MAG: lipoate--protein ligase [Clostridia bacterium]|nr:lipoate--protein ligase [Clostridia bacterium]
MKKRLIISKSHNPYENMAIEKMLMDEVEASELILYVYVNEPSLVIGRHQNPWKEIEMSSLVDSSIHIVRRLSGGGTVFHDKGNLNYAFIYRKQTSSFAKNFDLILEALRKIGINAQLTGRKDLRLDGRKISGNAFYQVGDKCLHHGTLLFQTNLDLLWQFLKFDSEYIKDNAVSSVRSQVLNLYENYQISMNQFLTSLLNCFEGELKTVEIHNEDPISFIHKVQLFSSWDWIFGETPKFNYELKGHCVEVNKGIITTVTHPVLDKMRNINFDENWFIKEVNNVSKTLCSSK